MVSTAGVTGVVDGVGGAWLTYRCVGGGRGFVLDSFGGDNFVALPTLLQGHQTWESSPPLRMHKEQEVP